ncbi:MAG: hypothetical protein NC033_05795 [Clostridiales bacterium]|nr:hypothetical protein [Clostridiales bacterium]
MLDNKKKRLAYFLSCEKWEDNDELLRNRHEKIEDILRNMSEDLRHIVQILQEENS